MHVKCSLGMYQDVKKVKIKSKSNVENGKCGGGGVKIGENIK